VTIRKARSLHNRDRRKEVRLVLPDRWRAAWPKALAAVVLTLVLILSIHPKIALGAWEQFVRVIGLAGEPLPASPAVFSEHEVEEIEGLPPQEQVMRLLPRATNHYQGAIELIERKVDGWHGSLDYTEALSGMLITTMDSNDLRVRAAAIEVYLAAWNVPKNSESVETLIDRAQSDPDRTANALWTLGLLGSRGVEAERVKETLQPYLKDPREEVRFWAVEGIALVATDDVIEPLLGVLHDDPSIRVRERAACSLAQTGMFETSQRMKIVPTLLDWMDEPGPDDTTRGFVFHALRDITGRSFGKDPAAWRAWWDQSH